MHIKMLGTAAADSVPAGTEVPIDESFSGLVFKTQKPLIVPDFAKETRFPTTAHLRPAGVQSFCMFPLTTPLRRLGAIAFGSSTIDLFKESELDYLGMVADQVAVAVDSVLHHEAAQSAERQLRRERDRLRLLLDVNNAVVANLSMDALFSAVGVIRRRDEQAAVVGRHVQDRVAPVHRPAQVGDAVVGEVQQCGQRTRGRPDQGDVEGGRGDTDDHLIRHE